MAHTSRWLAILGLLVGIAANATCQDVAKPVKVTIKDGKVISGEPALPLDPNPRIRAGYSGGAAFGLTLDSKRITCTAEGSIWVTPRIDNQEVQAGFDFVDNGRMEMPKPLAPGPYGKKRLGTQTTWAQNKIHFTQIIEIVPSKVTGKVAAGQKRRLDTARITYIAENKDTKPHMLELRTGIDILINNNDGALFASPTTVPDKVLDGVVLADKTLPEYIEVIENPDVKNPRFKATMTLKFGGHIEGPSKVVLTSLGAFGGGWDTPAQQAGGDSACAIYWSPKNLKPGEKREMVWAYGGGIATNPENEGKVSLALGGSFEPGKLFTILATVDDPVPSQTLTLELPKGMKLVEGKERANVAAPHEGAGSSVVLWKARVLETGEHEIRVRSSSGATQIKHVSVETAR